jgi:H+/gluconate symporter-like permease
MQHRVSIVPRDPEIIAAALVAGKMRIAAGSSTGRTESAAGRPVEPLPLSAKSVAFAVDPPPRTG